MLWNKTGWLHVVSELPMYKPYTLAGGLELDREMLSYIWTFKAYMEENCVLN